MRHDPYDVTIAFDDIYGDASPMVHHSPQDVSDVARRITHRHGQRKLKTPPMSVDTVVGFDTKKSFRFGSYRLLGDDATTGFPIFDDLRSKFASSTPAPKLVRVDTDDSYKDFCDARKSPYIAKLVARVTALENAFAQHASTDAAHFSDIDERFEQHLQNFHRGNVVAPVSEHTADLDVLGEAVMQSINEVADGGSRIPLPLPPWADGKICCWQDGDEVLCTIRLRGPSGQMLSATTGTPVQPHMDQVLGYADDVDADVDSTIVIVPVLVQVFAADSLISQLCKAAPELLSKSETAAGQPFTGAMKPKSDPSMAAAMALLQRTQRGDDKAKAEVLGLAATGGGDLIADAHERLQQAQALKATRGRLL